MNCRGLRATQTHVDNERLARLAGVALEDLLGNVALQKVILEAELGWQIGPGEGERQPGA